MQNKHNAASKLTAAAIAAALLASMLTVSVSAAEGSSSAVKAKAGMASALMVRRQSTLQTLTAKSVTVNYGAGASSTGKVHVSSCLNLRSAASTSSQIIGRLTNGQTVTILKNTNGWMQVTTSSGQTGYCSSSYITVTTTSSSQTNSSGSGSSTASSGSKATVKVSGGLNLRSAAGTSSKIISCLSNGESVTVLSTSNGWSYIQTSAGQKGYCCSTYLTVSSTSAPASNSGSSSVSGNEKATVKVNDSLNLRSAASTSSTVIGSLSNGQSVTVLSTSNGWSYIQTSAGQKGYCCSTYLTVSSTSAPASNSGSSSVSGNEKATVKVNDSLNLRSAASTSSTVIGSLSNGQSVTVLSTSNGWSYIQTSAGAKGYCCSTYLAIDGSTTNNPSNSSSKVLNGLPAYKQYDSEWANTYIGSSYGGTIHAIGCLVTSLAMSESYRTQSRVTPNDIAHQCNFTSGGGLYWPSNYYALSGVSDSNLSGIYQQLKSGKPVIVGGSNSRSSHWIIIKGYQNVPLNSSGSPTSLSASMFLINDPGYGNQTLADYFSQFPCGHVYRTY